MKLTIIGYFIFHPISKTLQFICSQINVKKLLVFIQRFKSLTNLVDIKNKRPSFINLLNVGVRNFVFKN